MVTGIELIRYQTKYRPNEHQKLPSKKPLVALITVILVRYLTLLYLVVFLHCIMIKRDGIEYLKVCVCVYNFYFGATPVS